jgi:hypothetical protein
MRVRKAIHGIFCEFRYGQEWTGTAQLRAVHEVLFYAALSPCLSSASKPGSELRF